MSRQVRKNIASLIGSEVNLLSDETVQKLICYTPKEIKSVEHYTIDHLLGATDNQIPFMGFPHCQYHVDRDSLHKAQPRWERHDNSTCNNGWSPVQLQIC